MTEDGQRMDSPETDGTHYCVLYSNVLKQTKMNMVLRRTIPDGKGTVFYPCMEAWRRGGGGRLGIIPLFPGYIFIRSRMDAAELHWFLRESPAWLIGFFRELGLSEKIAGGMDASEKDADFTVTDLDAEEARFMDFLLDIDSTAGGLEGETEEMTDRLHLPQDGLLRMSYGYEEGEGNYKVLRGPLRAYEKHIRTVNRHNRIAYLDFEVNGKTVKAGLVLKPKRYWFPEDEDAPFVLNDGTEVDIDILRERMMGASFGNRRKRRKER